MATTTSSTDRPRGAVAGDARPQRASPLLHRVRGNVLLLLCVLYAVLYFDRVNIATAGPNGLTSDLHLSAFQFGLASSAFALPYGLLQAGGGVLGDRFGARRTLVVVAGLCGACTVLTGLAGGLLSLLAARFLLGAAEGSAFPTATHALSTWLPVDRRGFAQGIVHAASRLSNALAPIVVAALISVPGFGWRGSFIVAGGLGLIWSLAWWIYFRDRPKEHHGVDTRELEELGRPPVERPEPTPWRLLVRRVWPVTLTDFCYGWMLWVYLIWMPSFFSKQYGLGLRKSALFTTMTLIGGVFGDYLGGALCDAILRRTGNLLRSRRAGLIVGFSGSALCVLPVLFVHSLALDTACLAAAFFFLELCNSPLWAIPMDIAPRHSGAASGLMNTGFGVAGVIAAPVFGFVVDRAGYPSALAVSAVLLVLGLLTVRLIDTRPLRHPDASPAAPA
ncbi:MAG: MFS transporter [Actinobacteria bacterium]|nr:MFS transporter [Actinomycetota bacterium]